MVIFAFLMFVSPPQATTEQLTFIGLFMYRMDVAPHTRRAILYFAAIQVSLGTPSGLRVTAMLLHFRYFYLL